MEENPYFFEEEFEFKLGIKRDHSNLIKTEGIDRGREEVKEDSRLGAPLVAQVKQESATTEKSNLVQKFGGGLGNQAGGKKEKEFELGRPQTYKFRRIERVFSEQQAAIISPNSLTAVFSPILSEINNYFEEMNKAEGEE